MTDEEKIQLRIKAAKAMGYRWYRRVSFDGENRRILIHPDSEYTEGIRRGLFVECDESVEPYGDFLRESPDPLTNAADCEALLVAMLRRKWKGWAMEYCNDGVLFALWHKSGESVGEDAATAQHYSDNPDPVAAYREAVTHAVVRAWEAEERI